MFYQLKLDLGWKFDPRPGQRVLVLKPGKYQYKTGKIATGRRTKTSTNEWVNDDYIINLRGKTIRLYRNEFTEIK
jgi:hypothetical protein